MAPHRSTAMVQLPLCFDAPATDDDGSPPYRVRLSRRARSLQIEVSPWRGVEVIVPSRTSAKRVQAFVTRNRSWIQRAWDELRALYPGPLGPRLPATLELAALGETWAVGAVLGATGRARVEVDSERSALCVHAADSESAMAALRAWLRARAVAVLPGWLARVADETGLRYARCQIRSQRTRWGSCSTRGTITLNDKLLFVRPALVNYLMVHELCHTRHFNHSRRFWALVTSYLADARERDRDLDSAWTAVPAWAGD